jgi:hypothetical protein
MNWVYLPAFDPAAPALHGGVLRSRQIFEALQTLGTVHKVLPGSARRPRARDVEIVLRAMLEWRLKPAHAIHYLRFHRELAPLRAAGEKQCFYEHQFGPGRIGAMAALDLGFEVIAAPHNLESLANWDTVDPLTGFSGAESLAWEVALLRRMKAVLTISREEMGLLRNLGVRAAYYAYWPDSATERNLLEMRRQRTATPATGPLLLLGSAINAPTAEGMSRLLTRLAGRRCAVVGLGVSRLAAQHPSPSFQFFDPADDATLARLQIAAPCACVHQDRGAGVLTRIRHLLLAGVPVVCNDVAARDYHDEPDLRVYPRLEEIGALVDDAIATPRTAAAHGTRPSLAAALAAAAELPPSAPPSLT